MVSYFIKHRSNFTITFITYLVPSYRANQFVFNLVTETRELQDDLQQTESILVGNSCCSNGRQRCV